MINLKNHNNREYQLAQFNQVLSVFSATKKKQILKTYKLLKQKHHGQFRHDGKNVPYEIHPLRCTIYLIKDLKINNVEMIQAMLLHDIVEDTDVTLVEVEKKFGKDVARLVNDLTRLRRKNESEKAKKTTKIIHLKHTLKNPDKRVRLLKATDLLDNLKSMPFIIDKELRERKVRRWHNEIKTVGIKIAHSVNLVIEKEMKEMLKIYNNLISNF